ncbi:MULTISPECIES: fimbria/pilus periplasmic chaperone [Enterobacter]|uniref:fimbria/pilus periplasmic chaperone n=1 Tax=Enterobacter TaxID=547 RepID=UPI001F22F180|nr:fimbria/pilus periplasmic chaperone [Enterobacter roggenkampii]MCE5967232.1 fimbria/pilus periplasmic chaperone [Enterobacter roggenkampii]MCE5971664.1 fimbria/pilus periplasmic chaperone [Enterobacter roggenkampii]UHY24935.1 fimbria/pilus periplasmic chaperone [Enterobacter roggenkampii]HDS5356310.1 fimbria/pilus periplasmic chaperone [Enterobacter kobei]
MKSSTIKNSLFVSLLIAINVQSALAAIALDRTRVIFDGNKNSVSLGVSNENTKLPYLAQGWLEDSKGNKITSPLTVLPPVQRIEPGSKSQVKIQALPSVSTFPTDRESLFYFNLREIPPRSEKANTMQLALQSRIKLFYRPKALVISAEEMASIFNEKITLTKSGNKYQVSNQTPYFITLVDARSSEKSEANANFKAVMIEPFGQNTLGVNANELGNNPVLTYINDYGGRPRLNFKCNANSCMTDTNKK